MNVCIERVCHPKMMCHSRELPHDPKHLDWPSISYIRIYIPNIISVALTCNEAMPEHFQPDPARPAGPARPWTLLDGPGQRSCSPRKNLGQSPARNAVFSYFTLLKTWAARPSPGPARARPEKRGPQLPMGRAWVGFFRPEKPGYFFARPGPLNALV
jgi:hypothetical protein